MKKIILLLTILLLPSVSGASPDDGNALLEGCNSAICIFDGKDKSNVTGKAMSMGLCMGLVRGMIDAGTIINTLAQTHDYTKHSLYCVPKDVSTIQAARVVVKYLEAHPKDLHQKGTGLIALALAKSFPCKK